MQLPENTPPTTPVVDAGDPFYSPERPPRNVTPVVDVDDPFLSPEGTSRNGTSGGDLSVALRTDGPSVRRNGNIFSMISPLTDAPTRGRAMYMDGRDAPCIPAIPATMDGYDAPVSSVSSAPPQPRVRIHRVYPIASLEANTSMLHPPVPRTLVQPIPRLGMTAEYIVRLIGPVVGIQTRWLTPHMQSVPDGISTFSNWSQAIHSYRIHYAANIVRVVRSTTAAIPTPATTAPIERPATPLAGSSRNPISVSSASPKKKATAASALPKRKYYSNKGTSRTRVNKALKRPSPIPSTPSKSPPRQRRRHSSPQAVSPEPIEISSDSDESLNDEAPAIVCGRVGTPSVLTGHSAVDSALDSGDDLPAPRFMFRTLASASPDDMYDSDSPAEATPSNVVTLAPSVQHPPNAVGASLDDMYDSDSPAEAAPSVHLPTGIIVGASPDDMYDSDSPAEAAPSVHPPTGNIVGASPDDMYDSDSHPEDTGAVTIPPSTPNRATRGRFNRATPGPSTPVGLQITRGRRHRQSLTPTWPQTPLGYPTVSGSTHSANNSPSPFAHLSQAELDSLLEEKLPSMTPCS